MLNINDPIENINKIGSATAAKLNRLNLYNVKDLLYHYPVRYNDFSVSVAIKDLMVGQHVNVQGTVEFIQNKRSFARHMMITECLMQDNSGQLKIIWFNQPFIGRSVKVGDKISVAGRVDKDFTGLMMSSPEYEKINNQKATHTYGLVPIYNLTSGLTNKQLRFLIKSIINTASQCEDMLPADILHKYDLVPLAQSLNDIHFPKDNKALNQAKRRLQFDELFAPQLLNVMRKLQLQRYKAESISFHQKGTQKFVKNLPFKLTDAQKKAAWDIVQDLNRKLPMSRLLEGDVGSGKTVAMAIALLNVSLNKKQSALLVPTEILALQHFNTLGDLFKNYPIHIGLFTRTQRKLCVMGKANNELKEFKYKIMKNGMISKKDMLAMIDNGIFDVVVGTHTMIQDDVVFHDLAFIVIDEQHRFGVAQRQSMRAKSNRDNFVPHLLSLTATPIPRSLAQTIFGDLDLSIIDQMPAGRKVIKTHIVPEQKRHSAYEFIKKEITKGRQAFVVCPLIIESDKLGVKSVEQEYKKLSQDIFPDLKIAYLHGKMKSADKEQIMQQFLDNKINILISTSVIEVGVDVPNATLMILEGAERFGMAQLHQFRGRVGRSSFQSYCLLFPTDSDTSMGRLNIFANTNDGFKLAEEDLKMRGPGEVYGMAQKGFPEFKLASLHDYALIQQVREAVQMITKKGLDNYPMLKHAINQKKEWLNG